MNGAARAASDRRTRRKLAGHTTNENTPLPTRVNPISPNMSPDAAFFAAEGDLYRSSELTRGPWDGESQHAGPPAALLAREIERCEGIGGGPEDRLVGRITLEIVRPVPIAPLRVSAEIVRPGRRVEMIEATLAAEDGTELVRARAWRLLRGSVELPPGLDSESPDGPAAAAGRPTGSLGRPPSPLDLPASEAFFDTGFDVGYHSAMEYRFALGTFVEPGPAACWLRMRHPLVAGEEPTPLQRVMIAADTGNGISATLDIDRFVFINVDLSVHLHRMPVGEWVCLDALTIPEPTGIGLADTMLLDERGPIGRACQTLLIAERSGS